MILSKDPEGGYMLFVNKEEAKCHKCNEEIQDNEAVYYCGIELAAYCKNCGRRKGDTKYDRCWQCLKHPDIEANRDPLGDGMYRINAAVHSHPLILLNIQKNDAGGGV